MSCRQIILVSVLAISVSAYSQEIPGLSYCLLFDSNLEKDAFQQSKSNKCDPLIFLLANDPAIDSLRYKKINAEIESYARQLETKQKKFGDERKFLRHLFNSVHRKYLKNYETLETFDGIFNGGSYNCVSGTALYACLLGQLGYPVKIYETRYHIFLLIHLADSTRVLYETTDPRWGFESNGSRIENRIKTYLSEEKKTLQRAGTLSAPFNGEPILESVSLKEVAGLHYYNIAVDLINRENYYDAFRALKKAAILYPRSQRIRDFLWYTQQRHKSQLSKAFVNN